MKYYSFVIGTAKIALCVRANLYRGETCSSEVERNEDGAKKNLYTLLTRNSSHFNRLKDLNLLRLFLPIWTPLCL